MYENIGKKLKGLAIAVFIIMLILSIVGGAIIIIVDDDLVAVGIVVMLVMPLVAWISSWFLYGFGELVDKVCDIEERNRRQEQDAVQQQKLTLAAELAKLKQTVHKMPVKQDQQAVSQPQNQSFAAVRICLSCGNKCGSGERFCSSCGKQLNP